MRDVPGTATPGTVTSCATGIRRPRRNMHKRSVPIHLRPAAPLVNALIKEPTPHYIITIVYFILFFCNW